MVMTRRPVEQPTSFVKVSEQAVRRSQKTGLLYRYYFPNLYE